MTLQNHFLKLIVLFALIGVAAASPVTRTRARQTQLVERTLNFSSVGFTRGQTIRLNSLAVGPCNIPAEFVFLDAEGAVLSAQDISVRSEHFESFDLNFDSLGRSEGRVQVRGLVKFAVHAEHIDQEDIVATLEVLDNKSQRSSFSWGHRGYKTGGSIDRTLNFGSIGIAQGQTVRINSLVVGPAPIPVEFVFIDQEGQVLGQITRKILPEHFESFELNFDSLGRFDPFGRREGRLQLRALVKFAPPDQQRVDVISTLEVVDNKTAKTTFGMSVPEPPELPAVREP